MRNGKRIHGKKGKKCNKKREQEKKAASAVKENN